MVKMLKVSGPEATAYVMGGFGVNSFVDASKSYDAAARYVNDNFDPGRLNARFDRRPAEYRALLVATRDIAPGEEIYASYGAS